MGELLYQWIPNFIEYFPEFKVSIGESLQMLGYAAAVAFPLGIALGVLLVVTNKGNILENQFIYNLIDKLTNLVRSIPFVILISALFPITRIVMGTPIGVRGMIFPLVVGCTPFFIRQVNMALSDVDKGLIEAAQSMGLSPVAIIFRIYLRESIPSLVRAMTITLISLFGLTTMGGAVGGGGIGAFVIRYGNNRYMYDITYVCVVVILIFVTVVESLGNYIVKKTTH